jgi:hypothetical protein
MPSILRTSVLIDFALRHDYIAKVLCINQDKPELQCDGKCYLAQQFKKAEENEKKTLHNYIVSSSEISAFILTSFTILLEPLDKFVDKTIIYKQDYYTSTFLARAEQPPEQV